MYYIMRTICNIVYLVLYYSIYTILYYIIYTILIILYLHYIIYYTINYTPLALVIMQWVDRKSVV